MRWSKIDEVTKIAANKQIRRTLPQNDLDLNLMMTDPVWGKPEVSEDLKNRLTRYYKDEQGQVSKEELWGLLGSYTRDMRLANLSTLNGELNYVAYYLDLANDLLQDNKVEAFLIALSRAATRLELSQSKGGFLRRRMNTFSQENTQQSLEPPKKSLFGGKQKEMV